jgi:ribosomal RNA-processing protein 8
MKQKKNDKQQEKLERSLEAHHEKLQGSSFRMLNELLYTQGSEAAFEHFQENPEDFEQYHEGYAHQMEKWPEKPVELVIKMLQDRYVIQSQQM